MVPVLSYPDRNAGRMVRSDSSEVSRYSNRRPMIAGHQSTFDPMDCSCRHYGFSFSRGGGIDIPEFFFIRCSGCELGFHIPATWFLPNAANMVIR